jgi:hypothetical protein
MIGRTPSGVSMTLVGSRCVPTGTCFFCDGCNLRYSGCNSGRVKPTRRYWLTLASRWGSRSCGVKESDSLHGCSPLSSSDAAALSHVFIVGWYAFRTVGSPSLFIPSGIRTTSQKH